MHLWMTDDGGLGASPPLPDCGRPFRTYEATVTLDGQPARCIEADDREGWVVQPPGPSEDPSGPNTVSNGKVRIVVQDIYEGREVYRTLEDAAP